MKEIARDLGVTAASVKARLHRARKRLLGSPAPRNRQAGQCHRIKEY
jgi:DNA-directed RNA polymerase specialized sigma24 family protein